MQRLELRKNQINTLASEIGNLYSLEHFSIEENQISSLPPEIGNLYNLEYFSIGTNPLTSLPPEIGNLTNLNQLSFNVYSSSLPTEIGNLLNLQFLLVGAGQLSSLPSQIGNLTNLTWLYVEDNQLVSIPSEVDNLINLEWIFLQGNRLTSVPDFLNHPNASSIELYVDGNRISVNDIADNLTGPDSYPFSYFKYDAQDDIIGEATTESALLGETISLQAFTSNHPQTRFQWQRLTNNTWTDIVGQTQEGYTITSAISADAGEYRCQITNDWVANITQYSEAITLEIVVPEGQVPDAVEYAALEAFYNATGGNSWRRSTNWLQGSTNIDFANWFGVTVENNDVKTISLSRNSLTGDVPSEIGNLLGLENLTLYRNSLTSLPVEIGNLLNLEEVDVFENDLINLPDLTGHPNASILSIYVDGNQINLNDIAFNLSGADAFSFFDFFYDFQAEIIGEATAVSTYVGGTTTLQAFTNNHPQTNFQWQVQTNGVWSDIAGAMQEIYTIASASSADAGQYRCQIENNWVSGATQYSESITLTVSGTNSRTAQHDPSKKNLMNTADATLLKVTAYPNPVGEQLHLAVEGAIHEPLSLRVTDVMGRVVLQQELTADRSSEDIAIRIAPYLNRTGLFYMTVEKPSSGERVVMKLLKQ